MTLHLGPAHAGAVYLVLGTSSGTAPALSLGGAHTLPLVVDGYTLWALAGANQKPFVNYLGTLDADGRGFALFDASTPAGAYTTSLHHAAVVLDAAGDVAHVTEAVPLTISP